jgi:hypothetical protein
MHVQKYLYVYVYSPPLSCDIDLIIETTHGQRLPRTLRRFVPPSVVEIKTPLTIVYGL